MNHLALRLAASAVLVLQAGQAAAQNHEQTFERYVLQSNVVSSLSIPQASAAVHGIRRAADQGILNVTVLKKGQSLQTVPARVRAHAVSLAGSKRDIEMKETTAGDWVSYTGTFSFAPREVLDFKIVAEPAGSGETLAMSYRERVWVDRQAP
jgi:hypothetical protein